MGIKIIVENRKARFQYHLEQFYEARLAYYGESPSGPRYEKEIQPVSPMKTLRLLLLAALAGGTLATVALAAPPSKRLPIPPGSAALPAASTATAKPMRMVVRNPGTKLKSTVVCSAEVGKSNPYCRIHCGK